MNDFELPSAFSEKERKARKPHECCECNQEIKIGEKYQYCSGIWDGEPSSYKTCLSCLTLRNDYKDKTGEDVYFAGLKEYITNAFYIDYGIVEFLKDYPENEAEIKKLFHSDFNKKVPLNTFSSNIEMGKRAIKSIKKEQVG